MGSTNSKDGKELRPSPRGMQLLRERQEGRPASGAQSKRAEGRRSTTGSLNDTEALFHKYEFGQSHGGASSMSVVKNLNLGPKHGSFDDAQQARSPTLVPLKVRKERYAGLKDAADMEELSFFQECTSICGCFKKRREEPEGSTPRGRPKRIPHPIVRNFKSMFCIANMFDLRELAKFSMCCRSFYWIAGRKQLLEKFYRRQYLYGRPYSATPAMEVQKEAINIAYEPWRQTSARKKNQASNQKRKDRPVSSRRYKEKLLVQKIKNELNSKDVPQQMNVIIIENNFYNNGNESQPLVQQQHDADDVHFRASRHHSYRAFDRGLQQQVYDSKDSFNVSYERVNVADAGGNVMPSADLDAAEGVVPPIDIITDQVGEYRPVFMPFQHFDSCRTSRSRKIKKSERRKQPASARNQQVSQPGLGKRVDLKAALKDDELLDALQGDPETRDAADKDLDPRTQAASGEERRLKAEQRRNGQNVATRRRHELNGSQMEVQSQGDLPREQKDLESGPNEAVNNSRLQRNKSIQLNDTKDRLGHSIQQTLQSLRSSQLDDVEGDGDQGTHGNADHSSTLMSEKTAQFKCANEYAAHEGSEQQLLQSENSLVRRVPSSKPRIARNYDHRSSSFSIGLISNKINQMNILASQENLPEARQAEKLDTTTSKAQSQAANVRSGSVPNSTGSPTDASVNLRSPTFVVPQLDEPLANFVAANLPKSDLPSSLILPSPPQRSTLDNILEEDATPSRDVSPEQPEPERAAAKPSQAKKSDPAVGRPGRGPLMRIEQNPDTTISSRESSKQNVQATSPTSRKNPFAPPKSELRVPKIKKKLEFEKKQYGPGSGRIGQTRAQHAAARDENRPNPAAATASILAEKLNSLQSPTAEEAVPVPIRARELERKETESTAPLALHKLVSDQNTLIAESEGQSPPTQRIIVEDQILKGEIQQEASRHGEVGEKKEQKCLNEEKGLIKVEDGGDDQFAEMVLATSRENSLDLRPVPSINKDQSEEQTKRVEKVSGPSRSTLTEDKMFCKPKKSDSSNKTEDTAVKGDTSGRRSPLSSRWGHAHLQAGMAPVRPADSSLEKKSSKERRWGAEATLVKKSPIILEGLPSPAPTTRPQQPPSFLSKPNLQPRTPMTPTSNGRQRERVSVPNPEVQRTDTAVAASRPLRLAAIGPTFRSTMRAHNDESALHSSQGAIESTPRAKKPQNKPTQQLPSKLTFTPAQVSGPPKPGGVTSPKELNPLSVAGSRQSESLLDRAPRQSNPVADTAPKPRNGPIQWRALQNANRNNSQITEHQLQQQISQHQQAQVTTLLSSLSQRPGAKPSNLGAKPFRNRVAALANARKAEDGDGRSSLPRLKPMPNVSDFPTANVSRKPKMNEFKTEKSTRKVSEAQRGSGGPKPGPKIVVGGHQLEVGPSVSPVQDAMRSTFHAAPGKKPLEPRDEMRSRNRRSTYKEQARRLVSQCLPAPVKQPAVAPREQFRAEGEVNWPGSPTSAERLPPAPIAEKHLGPKVADAEAAFLKNAMRAFEKYHGAIIPPKAESQRRISRYEKQMNKRKKHVDGESFQNSIEHSSSQDARLSTGNRYSTGNRHSAGREQRRPRPGAEQPSNNVTLPPLVLASSAAVDLDHMITAGAQQIAEEDAELVDSVQWSGPPALVEKAT